MNYFLGLQSLTLGEGESAFPVCGF